MKLDYIEVCGFRGFREKLRVTFGSGFTVFVGRNGVGKSTLFDAVEYALTGSIDKYMVERAAQESLSDYLWWRGDGKAEAYYVTASFKDVSGKVFTIKRTRESGADKTVSEIENAFCKELRPEDALRQLCRTSIIRDEWIAALSVDLSDTERFEYVRNALGLGQSSALAAKAKAVLKAAESAHKLRKDLYEEARNQLTRAIRDLAEAKEAIANAGDAAAAMQILRDSTPGGPEELIARLNAGRAALAAGRSRLTAIGKAIYQGREVQALRGALEAPESVARRSKAQQNLAEFTTLKEKDELLLAEAARVLEIEERSNDIAASLAALIEHGTRLGTNEAHCPLCAAIRSHEEFTAGIALARRRMETLASGVSEARQRLNKARDAAARSLAAFNRAASELAAIKEEDSRLFAQEQAHIEIFENNNLDFRFVNDLEGLEHFLSTERDRLIELERALLTLDVSQTVSRIASIEGHVVALRAAADAAASSLEQAEQAVTAAKVIDRSVKSVSGELIDERLAQISPLLNELYQRLRPHFDWRSIEYSIRGDVRRFLSLRVGDGLNPQFVFSSGQRRAAGLAFLLSVHLARDWTPWRTLLMDDPVQHIDDFRALHLIEVLAALRLGGKQVVCAVEDEALADLLCRRLLSSSESPGKRYELGIGSEGATVVIQEADIPPMPVGVLRSRTAIQVVG